MEIIKNSKQAIDASSIYKEMHDLNDKINSSFPQYNMIGPIAEHVQTLDRFNSYSCEIKEKLYSDFTIYSSTLTSALDELDVDRTERCVLWNILRKLGVHYDDDLFESIGPEDVVEIYTADNIQVYRNFRFHQLCNYKLPELFTIPWNELFEREPFFTKQIITAFTEGFQSSGATKTSLSYIKPHKLKELGSESGAVWTMEPKFIFTLANKNLKSVDYVLSIAKVNLVSNNNSTLNLNGDL